MIRQLHVEGFRCLEAVDLAIPPEGAAIIGDNGAGKTSLLEAIYFLIRGRSFRQSRAERLIQHGGTGFLLRGSLDWRGGSHQVGVSVDRSRGAQIRVDGDTKPSLAEVSTAIAIQVLEPEVHRLVADGPDARRGFIDYGVFHVEPSYLSAWRRYRNTLKQRNAALKQIVSDQQLLIWDQQLAETAATVDGYRQGYVNLLQEPLNALVDALALPTVELSYQPGWKGELSFEEALASARGTDRERATTSVGPHRADMAIRWSGRLAKPMVSRGQQKLLASALILAQAQLVSGVKQDNTILLLDDPGAELDRGALDRLLGVISSIPGQHIVTALDIEQLPTRYKTNVFHVEQGAIVAG
ncbi:MAG: DNA replication/repair protein RecF [Pseudomonadota bacterium]